MIRAYTLTAPLLAVLAAACGTEVAPGDSGDTSRVRVRIENIAPWTVLKSGVHARKVGGGMGALGSGDAYELSFTAGAGQAISFAAMLGESNDWFFAPGPAGIPLYDASGMPVSGDVTAHVGLWDAGTEHDQEPAVGADTGPMQDAPDQGAPDPIAMVRPLGASVALSDGSSFDLPAVDQMIRVTLTPQADRRFVLRIENVSTDSTLVTSQGARQIHVSPLVWSLHIAAAPLFDQGAPDREWGLEGLAEAGRTGDLAAAMASLTGVPTAISPGVVVLHQEGEPIYSLGLPDRGEGLERIAEDGDPSVLSQRFLTAAPAGARLTGVFDTAVGAYAPGPARPGEAYEIVLDVEPGDRLSFATMFGWSNDWFFATPAGGIELTGADGAPLAGDVSHLVGLYDAGSELDEEIAIGAHTAPQQAERDSGPADPIDQVRAVGAAEYQRDASAHLRVTLIPEQ